MEFKDESRAARAAITVAPWKLDRWTVADGPWAESPQEVREGLRRGRRKALLLAWVRLQMAERLSECERLCIEQHYFEGLSYAEIAQALGRNKSSVCRAIQRGLCRLRAAAQEDPSWREALKRTR